jgi:hypothetical protein
MYNKYSRLTEIHRQQTLEKFGGKASKDWTEEEKRKDRKALSSIQIHLSNDILQECVQEETNVALLLKPETICMSKDLTSKMHMKMKLFTLKIERHVWIEDRWMVAS